MFNCSHDSNALRCFNYLPHGLFYLNRGTRNLDFVCLNCTLLTTKTGLRFKNSRWDRGNLVLRHFVRVGIESTIIAIQSNACVLAPRPPLGRHNDLLYKALKHFVFHFSKYGVFLYAIFRRNLTPDLVYQS